MFLLLLCSFVAHCLSQVHNYYIYPPNSSVPSYVVSDQPLNGQLDGPSQQQFARDVPSAIQSPTNQASPLGSDPVIMANNPTTLSSLRSESTMQDTSTFGNSTVLSLSTSTPFANISQTLFNQSIAQNDPGIARINNTGFPSGNTSGVIFNDNQTTLNSLRNESTAQNTSGLGNSTVSNLATSTPFSTYINQSATSQPAFRQNDTGIGRISNPDGVICPFNDPNAGVCTAGRCPSGFVCNVGNVCCPCTVGAAQGACSAGACSLPSLRCEAASGMCCPVPLNATSGMSTTRAAPLLAMDTARNESGTGLQSTLGPILSTNLPQQSTTLASISSLESITTSASIIG